jgi:U3 small nucleolar RNA-associated protein 12
MARTRAIELGGHRSDVRSLAMSSDGSLLLTASNGSVKLWNTTTCQSVRTMKGGYALCCAFVPGDLHALVGTKTGNLIVYNLASGLAVHDVAAHEGALWSLAIRPDGRGFMTGGADKQVRFWEFELADQEPIIDDDMEEDNGGESDTSSVEDEKERERMLRMKHAAGEFR